MKENDYKVLMVDDDELIVRSTSDYFNIVGVKTAYVTSFDAAIKFLEKTEVSLLLLDINLGDKSGFELCRKVRESYDMPIFFISARIATLYSNDETKLREAVKIFKNGIVLEKSENVVCADPILGIVE